MEAARPEFPASRSRTQAAVRVSESVPSPNRRRTMYGSRRAAVSASAVPDPPRSQAMLASLANPRSLESSVPPVTTRVLSMMPLEEWGCLLDERGTEVMSCLLMAVSQKGAAWRMNGAKGNDRRARPSNPYGRPCPVSLCTVLRSVFCRRPSGLPGLPYGLRVPHPENRSDCGWS